MNQIKIGGIIHTLEYVERLTDESGGQRLNGHILHDQCVIKLEQTLHPQMVTVTLLHEIIHGILTQAGLNEHNERLTEIIAFGLYQVLRDNPKFVNSIMGNILKEYKLSPMKELIGTDGRQ